MQPSYLLACENGKLDKTIAKAFKMLESCAICPRRCGVNRLKNESGFCRTGIKPKVCSFMPHHGEEPAISGNLGSGTIFFSCCNMACVYCQNFEFSQQDEGREVEIEELAKFMLSLQQMNCHNINLVTPTHVMPQILSALKIAAAGGLKIPLVYNTGGYELPEIIELLDGIVDIYLADARYSDAEAAIKYSFAQDYPEHNQNALIEMQRQVGIAKISNAGIIEKGLIIRVLVLPGDAIKIEKIMEFISRELSTKTYISLMSQYSPYYKAGQFPEISRRLEVREYQIAKKAMHKYGLYNGWTQSSGGLERFAGVNIKPILK